MSECLELTCYLLESKNKLKLNTGIGAVFILRGVHLIM